MNQNARQKVITWYYLPFFSSRLEF